MRLGAEDATKHSKVNNSWLVEHSLISYVPRRRRACRRWWSKLLQIHCHTSSPPRGCNQTQGHTVSLAYRPTWFPATPLQWHTWITVRQTNQSVKLWDPANQTHSIRLLKSSEYNSHWPEEKEHSLREGLEVIVSVDVSAIHHRNLPKHLEEKHRPHE